MLQDILFISQRFLLTNGNSTRHSRDMDQTIPPPGNGAGATAAQEPVRRSADEIRMWCEEKDKIFLKPHLDSLEKYVAKDGAKGFTRDVLFEILTTAASIYVGRRHADGRRAHLGDLQRAAPPLSFLELLRHERGFVICALAEGPGPQQMQRGAEKYEALVSAVEKIASVMPDPPPARGPGKKPNPKNLYALVAYLASQWERVTDRRFSQSWHTDNRGRRVPLATGGAAFVYDVVKLIDPARLGEVPKITEGLVRREHNEGTSYWSIFSRHLSGES
jgi:hypothetical protein